VTTLVVVGSILAVVYLIVRRNEGHDDDGWF
jgi:hypothetical protein